MLLLRAKIANMPMYLHYRHTVTQLSAYAWEYMWPVGIL